MKRNECYLGRAESLGDLKLLNSGKVRDIYSLGDEHLCFVTSDRISAFDVVMPRGVPHKGRILTAIAAHWFARTADIIPNHLADLPLEQVEIKSWRGMIGYVPQETLLLHDTVLINVTLGDPELSEEDAEYALRAAGAWEFVTAMPQGMYSTVGERGDMLSGGQRQRIAIARAIVHKPKLLILDEPTSALDRDSEAAICETLQQLSGEYTILAISHQTALMEAADRAYRMQNGNAVFVEDVSTASAPSDDIEDDSGLSAKAAIVPRSRG